MVHCWELRACTSVAGTLLLLTEVSPALLALSYLLNHCLLLQQGPRGKGAVDDLVVISLTAEAPTSHCLGHCSVQYGYVKLLVKGTQQPVVESALVPELGIITQDRCPVEMLIQVRDVPTIVRQLHVPVRIKTEQSILIYMPCMQPELKIRQVFGFPLGGKRQLAVYYLEGRGVVQAGVAILKSHANNSDRSTYSPH